MDDSHLREQSQEEDGDPVEDQATDGDDSIIDETLDISTVKDRTRSRSKKHNIPQAIHPSKSEDEMNRPPRRTRA